MIIKVVSIATKNGIIALEIASIERPEIPDPTNKLTPNGGVMNPIAKLTTMIIPKWIGSIPMFTAIGSKIGVKIMIAANVSIKQPTINSNNVISKMIIIGFSEIDNIKSVTICGICSIVNSLPKAVAVPIIIKTVAVVKAESANIFGNSTIFNSRYNSNDATKPYTTAITAASVGVKTPPYIPPRIITGTSNAYLASQTAFKKPENVLFSSVPLYPIFFE